MTWKYPVKDFEDGDVISSNDWNSNVSHYVEEINGGLDRDNLPDECVTVGQQAAPSVFNSFAVKELRSPVVLPNIDSGAWIDTPLTRTDISISTDTLLLVEASVAWEIQPKFQGKLNFSSAVVGQTLEIDKNGFLDHMRIEFQLLVDGFQVGYGGPCTRYATKNAIFLCGALSVSVGSHEVKLVARFFESPVHDDTELAKWSDQVDFYDAGFFRWTAGELVITKRSR